jgi:HPt (histidine-containing phosphotransfer) domain-containing protein
MNDFEVKHVDEIIDTDAILSLVDGDLELLAELVNLFIDTTPQLLTEIREAISRSDNETLAKAAHTLKGSVGNFATKGAYELALQLEQIGRHGSLADAEEVYATLDRELERLKPSLVKLLETANH